MVAMGCCQVFSKNTIQPIGGWRFFEKPLGLNFTAKARDEGSYLNLLIFLIS
jgi:hypothetical protein